MLNIKLLFEKSEKGAESTGSRERSHIDATEKLWIHSIIKDDQKKVKELLEERLDLLEYRDYILGVCSIIITQYFFIAFYLFYWTILFVM